MKNDLEREKKLKKLQEAANKAKDSSKLGIIYAVPGKTAQEKANNVVNKVVSIGKKALEEGKEELKNPQRLATTSKK